MNAAVEGLEQALEKLVSDGLLSADDLAEARRRAERSGLALEDELIGGGLVTEELLCGALAHALDTAYVFPDADNIDLDLLARFPEELLWQLEVLPMVRIGDTLTVAAARPLGDKDTRVLEKLAGGPIHVVLATRRKILRVLEAVCGRPGRPEAQLGREGERRALSGSVADPAAVTLLFGTLVRAHEAGAREVRFEPHPSGLRVRRREADGRLVPAGEAPLELLPSLVTRARILAGETEYRSRFVGTRRVGAELAGEPVRLAISVLEGDSRGAAVRIEIEPVRGDETTDGAVSWLVRRCAGYERGLLLVHGGSCALRRHFGAALVRRLDPDARAVAFVHPAGEPAPVDAALCLELAPGGASAPFEALGAYRPDAVVLVPDAGALSRGVREALVRLAEAALVVVVHDEPDAACAVAGWLEAGVRPSRFARALRAVAGLQSGAGREQPVWEPDRVSRRALACAQLAPVFETLGFGARP